jgi:hypothetical protein
MEYRKLRIAFSATCGIACVLLMALCVRSYTWCDVVFCPTTRPILANAVSGVIQLNLLPKSIGTGWGPGWGWKRFPPDKLGRGLANRPSWQWPTDPTTTVINFPTWSVMLPFAATAVLPWIRHFKWRFSLRTLLIATTVVALVLGLIIYATRG